MAPKIQNNSKFTKEQEMFPNWTTDGAKHQLNKNWQTRHKYALSMQVIFVEVDIFAVFGKDVVGQGLLKLLWTVYSEGNLQSCLKLRNFQNPFNKDKSVGL